MSKTVVPEQRYVESMFAAYFARKFYVEHRAEIQSTSPYAVTDKTPPMRIVDNPITTGSWSGVNTEVTRGFFGGIKDIDISGGGGSIDTKVQFDHVSMCPVTSREFLDRDLEKYHDDWIYRVESHGRTEVRQMIQSDNPMTLRMEFRYYEHVFSFRYDDLESLQMQHRDGDELVEFIESHKVNQKAQTGGKEE